MTGFIFLGIVGNTEDKVTIYHGSNCLSHWPMANLGMMLLLEMDPQLHTSMYFFLGHLSFCVLCYSTAMHPKMIMDLFAKNKSIPFYGCALQFLVFCIFADSEYLLLAVMAYDQYKAISSPLLSVVSMSSRVCSLLMAGAYLVGMADALIHTALAFRLCFCGSNESNHFPVIYLHLSSSPALIYR